MMNVIDNYLNGANKRIGNEGWTVSEQISENSVEMSLLNKKIGYYSTYEFRLVEFGNELILEGNYNDKIRKISFLKGINFKEGYISSNILTIKGFNREMNLFCFQSLRYNGKWGMTTPSGKIKKQFLDWK